MATNQESIAMEPLKYQTWNLKVSIHCEGCKRKVKKVLQSIEGVYTTSIDSQQHKVTVTGSVPLETLIKKLIKTGKQAQLWPELPKKPSNQNPEGNNSSSSSKKKSKSKSKPTSNEASGHPERKNESEDGGGHGEEEEEEEEDNPSPPTEVKHETSEPNSNSKSGAPPRVETGMPSPAAKKKKKKKKNKKSSSSGNSNPTSHGQNNGYGNGSGVMITKPAGGSEDAKKHAAEVYYNLQPPTTASLPVPQYVVSYSTAMPPPMAGSLYIPTTTVGAEGSCDFFSEENANACTVM